MARSAKQTAAAKANLAKARAARHAKHGGAAGSRAERLLRSAQRRTTKSLDRKSLDNKMFKPGDNRQFEHIDSRNKRFAARVVKHKPTYQDAMANVHKPVQPKKLSGGTPKPKKYSKRGR